MTPDTAQPASSALPDFRAHVSVSLNMAQIFSFLGLKDGGRVGTMEKTYIKAFPKAV